MARLTGRPCSMTFVPDQGEELPCIRRGFHLLAHATATHLMIRIPKGALIIAKQHGRPS